VQAIEITTKPAVNSNTQFCQSSPQVMPKAALVTMLYM
jgi:hypothetical protein